MSAPAPPSSLPATSSTSSTSPASIATSTPTTRSASRSTHTPAAAATAAAATAATPSSLPSTHTQGINGSLLASSSTPTSTSPVAPQHVATSQVPSNHPKSLNDSQRTTRAAAALAKSNTPSASPLSSPSQILVPPTTSTRTSPRRTSVSLARVAVPSSTSNTETTKPQLVRGRSNARKSSAAAALTTTTPVSHAVSMRSKSEADPIKGLNSSSALNEAASLPTSKSTSKTGVTQASAAATTTLGTPSPMMTDAVSQASQSAPKAAVTDLGKPTGTPGSASTLHPTRVSPPAQPRAPLSPLSSARASAAHLAQLAKDAAALIPSFPTPSEAAAIALSTMDLTGMAVEARRKLQRKERDRARRAAQAAVRNADRAARRAQEAEEEVCRLEREVKRRRLGLGDATEVAESAVFSGPSMLSPALHGHADRHGSLPGERSSILGDDVELSNSSSEDEDSRKIRVGVNVGAKANAEEDDEDDVDMLRIHNPLPSSRRPRTTYKRGSGQHVNAVHHQRRLSGNSLMPRLRSTGAGNMEDILMAAHDGDDELALEADEVPSEDTRKQTSAYGTRVTSSNAGRQTRAITSSSIRGAQGLLAVPYSSSPLSSSITLRHDGTRDPISVESGATVAQAPPRTRTTLINPLLQSPLLLPIHSSPIPRADGSVAVHVPLPPTSEDTSMPGTGVDGDAHQPGLGLGLGLGLGTMGMMIGGIRKHRRGSAATKTGLGTEAGSSTDSAATMARASNAKDCKSEASFGDGNAGSLGLDIGDGTPSALHRALVVAPGTVDSSSAVGGAAPTSEHNLFTTGRSPVSAAALAWRRNKAARRSSGRYASSNSHAPWDDSGYLSASSTFSDDGASASASENEDFSKAMLHFDFGPMAGAGAEEWVLRRRTKKSRVLGVPSKKGGAGVAIAVGGSPLVRTLNHWDDEDDEDDLVKRGSGRAFKRGAVSDRTSPASTSADSALAASMSASASSSASASATATAPTTVVGSPATSPRSSVSGISIVGPKAAPFFLTAGQATNAPHPMGPGTDGLGLRLGVGGDVAHAPLDDGHGGKPTTPSPTLSDPASSYFAGTGGSMSLSQRSSITTVRQLGGSASNSVHSPPSIGSPPSEDVVVDAPAKLGLDEPALMEFDLEKAAAVSNEVEPGSKSTSLNGKIGGGGGKSALRPSSVQVQSRLELAMGHDLEDDTGRHEGKPTTRMTRAAAAVAADENHGGRRTSSRSRSRGANGRGPYAQHGTTTSSSSSSSPLARRLSLTTPTLMTTRLRSDSLQQGGIRPGRGLKRKTPGDGSLTSSAMVAESDVYFAAPEEVALSELDGAW